MHGTTLRYTLTGSLSLLFWGTSLPFARRCSEDLGPFTTAVGLMFVNGLIGAILFRKLYGPCESPFLRQRPFKIRTALYVAYMFLLYLALGFVAREQVPTVIFLNYLWPSATILFSLILFPQTIRLPLLVVGTVLVISGIAVELLGIDSMSAVWSLHLGGSYYLFLAAFIAALCWGLSSALVRKWGDASGGARAVPYVLLFSAAFLLPMPFLFGESPNPTRATIIPFVYLAFSPLLGHLCWDIGMRKGNVVALSLIADTLPWISLTFSKVYLGVGITRETWIAAVMIVAGAVISRFALRQSRV